MLAAIPHPEGRLVLFNSEMIGDPDKKALLTALYGELAAAWFDGEKQPILDEGCLFLSETQHPFEVAVFRCIHEGDVQGGSSSVLGICAQRKAYITDAWQGSEYEDVTAGAVVTCIGAYVILAVSKDTDTAIRAAEKLIS